MYADHISEAEADFAVIVSDELFQEMMMWIAETIKDTGDAKELARDILEKAAQKHGCEDDMTALTTAVENRK